MVEAMRWVNLLLMEQSTIIMGFRTHIRYSVLFKKMKTSVLLTILDQRSNNRNGYQKYYGDGNPGASGEMVTLKPALIRLSKQLGRTFRYQSYY